MKIGTEEKMTLILGLEQLKSNGDIRGYAIDCTEWSAGDNSFTVTLFPELDGSSKKEFAVYGSSISEPRTEDFNGSAFNYNPIEEMFSQCYAALECASEKGSEL